MASPEDGSTSIQRWLELYTEDYLYKVISKTFNREKASCVTQMIGEGKGTDVLVEIEKCNTNSSSLDRRALFFALALCAKSQNVELRAKAGKTFLSICRTPRELFTYLKMLKTLSSNKGFGNSIRKAVTRWYNQQDPKEFVKMATRYRSYNGWSHRDVLRVIHVTGDSDGKDSIWRTLYFLVLFVYQDSLIMPPSSVEEGAAYCFANVCQYVGLPQ